MIEQGYSRGVLMGGTLNSASRLNNEAPVFIISAQADAGTPEYPEIRYNAYSSSRDV